ncbi:hypothetical protein N4G58_18810 [Edwardsiella piscicida]|nr:hypothetical protein N4G58_18810 [Edwardsiella piscicida]
MAYQHFKLSSAGRLATIIAISFVACSSFAGNIVPDGGALGPGVATAPSGAQVVNIVTPTDRGCPITSIRILTLTAPARCSTTP